VLTFFKLFHDALQALAVHGPIFAVFLPPWHNSAKYKTRAHSKLSVILRRCTKTHKTPTLLPMSSVKQAISEKIRRASGMLVSAVALYGGGA
jgi:hypothetical protein